MNLAHFPGSSRKLFCGPGHRWRSKNFSVPSWKISQNPRPRHKLDALGASALTNAELLSILIGTGSRQEDAVRLCARVLADCGNNLNTLGKRSASQLMAYHGLGFSKVMTILAAVELGRRRQAAEPEQRPDLGTATRIYRYMHPRMMDLQVEEFWALLMNQHYRLIKAVRIGRGGLTETSVDIRLIMRECVTHNATILAVCHNHPSGGMTPAIQDDNLTTAIKRACNIMRVHMLDHVIVTDGQYYSYHEQGKL